MARFRQWHWLGWFFSREVMKDPEVIPAVFTIDQQRMAFRFEYLEMLHYQIIAIVSMMSRSPK
jgi:hypothetical protein